jgi:hypothetical protein
MGACMKFFLRCVLLSHFILQQGMLMADPYNDERSNLTDDEIYLRDNYVHEGHDQRIFQATCKENEKLCLGQDHAVWGARGFDMTIESIAKMYGMIMGFASKLKTMSNNEEGKKDEVMDKCALGVMATEMVAMTWQQASQQQISTLTNTVGNTQISTLEKAKKSYETRSKTAYFQGAGFAAATACYLTYTTVNLWTSPSGSRFDNSPVYRMLISATLATYFMMKGKANEDYANKIGTLIKEFKDKTGRGKCNPITQTLCYCAQPETQYDVKYCLPKEYSERLSENGETIVSCIDERLNVDNECRCKQRNTCYDVKFLAEGNFASNEEKFGKALAPYRNMFRGKFEKAAVSNAITGQMAANKRWLSENDPFKADDFELGKNGKGQAAFLRSMGLPPGFAAKIASEPKPDNFNKYAQQEKQDFLDMQNGLSLLASRGNGQGKGESKVLYFEQAGAGKSYEDNDTLDMDMLNKLNKQKNQADATVNRVLMFDDKATRHAQIHNDPRRSIFEIVSSRYRSSAWQRFDLKKRMGK